jgi:putative ABC transport system permease protein
MIGDRLRGVWKPVRGLLRRAETERELDEELRFHMEMEAARLVRQEGIGEPEARRRARAAFGPVERSREGVRDARWTRLVEELARDVRLSLRRLRGDPGFTAVAVVTLALGIGGTAAVFGVVSGVLLSPLPYEGADRIVTLAERREEGGTSPISEPNFEDWRARSGSFEVMALHGNPASGGPATVLGAETAVRARPTPVFDDFLSVFRVTPALGRDFVAEERQQGGPGAVLVSHSFWRTHLGSDPDVLGRPLSFWGATREVVGVMPEGFHFPADTDLWLPAEQLSRESATNRRAHNWMAVGRLRPGVSVAAANAEMSGIGAALREELGEGVDARGAAVTGLRDAMVGDLRNALLLLLVASGLVLLIACSNLAGTLLGRGVARGREVAVRTALGATRGRIARQLVTESLTLAVLGGIAGLALAHVLVRALLPFGPASLDPSAIGLDSRVLTFALAVTAATTLLVGLVPALRTSAVEAGEAIRSGTRGNTGSRSRLWRSLIGVEVALAIVLLTGSGLLLRSFAGVVRIDPGFVADPVLTVEVALPLTKYDTYDRMAGYYAALLDDLATVPGVEAAGLIQHLPFGGVDWAGSFELEGRGSSDETGLYGHYRIASAGYFEAMGIPVLEGRAFTRADQQGTLPAAVINETLARRGWPGEPPVGKRVRGLANEPGAYADEWLTIVGVVGDVRHAGLLDDPSPEIYVNVLQRPARANAAVVTLRAAVPPADLAGPVRTRIRALDADVPAELVPMSDRIRATMATRLFTVLVLGLFAGVALVLAAVGIYGVVTYTVARRTREIGIRLALGATPRRVRAMIQRDVLPVVIAGLAAGLVTAVLATRLIAGLLHDVGAADPAVLAAVTALLAAVAWLASWVPARRTTRVDPMATMRGE